jgi:hypothetical protein
MAAIDVTKKLLIYHTLYRLNLSFSNIVMRKELAKEEGELKKMQDATKLLQAK